MKETLSFSAHAFCVESVQKACYRFTDELGFHFDYVADRNSFLVTVEPLSEMDSESFRKSLLKLQNEVLDQELRLKIRAETEGIRNAILAYAFSKTTLQG